MAQNSPELLLLKFLPLTYHHSHFLAATLDFTSFFTITFLRAALFLYSLAVLGYISLLFIFVYSKVGGAFFNLSFFSLPQEEEKMKQMLNTLNIEILSVNVQIIICNRMDGCGIQD